VARQFMEPAPRPILRDLVERGMLTSEEAQLAAHVPIAEDITVEADSGGHTNNQPLGALFPVIANLRDQLTREHGYERPIRVGAAGGIGTPQAAASAFGLGAAYVLTGSVNQAAVESGLSMRGKKMLANTTFGDVMMAPAADMFELGVKLQVLKRGTMFGVRAEKLWEIYSTYRSLDEIPDDVRESLEKRTLSRKIDDIWAECESFWTRRDPAQLERAARDPRHQMALVFRWYLGMSSRWAIKGDEDRLMDYQIWCGPAMAAFNDWTRGSFLEEPENRGVVPIALNLLEGAASVTRAQQLRAFGVPVPPAAFHVSPRKLAV
jgi:PfaD family protein